MPHTDFKVASSTADPVGIEEVSALLKASRAVLEATSFEECARTIFSEACRVTGAESGYVALLAPDGEENEVLFLEAGDRPCTVDPELPMPIRGLRAESYRKGAVVWDNDFMDSEWVEFMPGGHVELKNVMFAPLIIETNVAGIMGLANKEGDFTEYDAHMAGAFGEFAAVALRNSRNLDLLRDTVSKLEKAQQEVRTLKGIIPICARCKKVHDDKGYWRQVEEYVRDRSEAEFSHGLCPDCAEIYMRELRES